MQVGDDARASRPAGCALCGGVSPAAARFCMHCGATLREQDGPGGPESERKVVTVLYADLSGSFDLIRDADCEEAAGVLDRAVDVMRRSVRRYGGFVAQNLGDGIMALFGAPVAVEDHAERAAYAALDMLAGIERLNRESPARAALRLRVGINTGETMVRAVEDDTDLHYSAVGPVNHLAARMEQSAAPGTIRLTGHTARLLGPLFRLRALSPQLIAGLAEPVAAFELLGADPWEGSFRVRTGRGLAPFVARDAELAKLTGAIRAGCSGSGTAVTVVGEAGVGKSRLVHEVLAQALPRDGLVFTSGGLAFGEVAPWLPIASVLRRVFAVEETDTAPTASRKLRDGLERLGVVEVGLDLPLLACLDLAGGDPAWLALDAATRRNRVHHALDRLLDALALQAPLVLVVEDLQWVDRETLGYLDRLTLTLSGRHLTLLTTARPGFTPPWSGRSGCLVVPLEPMGEDAITAVVDAIMGRDPSLDALKRELARRVAGNPFFAEESVRELVDLGWLSGAAGALRLARPLHAIPLPISVRATVAARIDRLPLADRAVLRAAATIGEVVDPLLLEQVAAVTPESLDSSVRRLVAADFLRLNVEPGRQGLRFRHALTAEIAYEGIIHRHRRNLHRRAVGALDGRVTELSTERLAALARHAFAAELWSQAFAAFREVAQRALARSAAQDVWAACDRAEAALEAMPARDRPDGAAVDITFLRADACFASGDHERLRAANERALALARENGDARRLAQALTRRAIGHWMRGELAENIRSSQEACEIAERMDDLDLRINTKLRLCMAYQAHGMYERTVEPFEWVRRELPRDRLDDLFNLNALPSVVCTAALARSLGELAEFDRGATVGAEGLERALASGHRFSIAYACREVGMLYLRAERFAESCEVLARGLEIVAPVPNHVLFPAIASAYGYVLGMRGEVDRGLGLIEEAERRAEAMGVRIRRSQQCTWMAELLLLRGERARARELAERATALAQSCEERGNEAWAWLTRARVAERDHRSRAEQYCDALARAHALAREYRLLTLEAVLRRSCVPPVAQPA
jgi:class 3 adenylate cyclase/tetratricopeptide (TPR) repeat protein